MLIMQVVAALLVLLGSALIFRALLEIDAPSRPQRPYQPVDVKLRMRAERQAESDARRARLPRAA